MEPRTGGSGGWSRGLEGGAEAWRERRVEPRPRVDGGLERRVEVRPGTEGGGLP